MKKMYFQAFISCHVSLFLLLLKVEMEQHLKKAESAERRKMQSEKAAREAEVEMNPWFLFIIINSVIEFVG